MAIYNVNQNRQFYVVTAVNKTQNGTLSTEGEISVLKTSDEETTFFKYFSPGGLTRSDLIDINKVTYTKYTPKAEMRRHANTATVKVKPEALDEGKPIAGQDYVLRIQVNNYLGAGSNSTLIRSGVVHATKGMTLAQFCQKMAESLIKNFSRDSYPLFDFGYDSTSGSEGIRIVENLNQPWRRGALSQAEVNFEVVPSTVRIDGDDVVWTEVEYSKHEDDYVGNGKKLADLEYFCQAERGDMYRNLGWPDNIDVKYMVDPSKEYNVIDIHYYYSGDGVQSHKSEKDITLVIESDTVAEDLANNLSGAGVDIYIPPKEG